MVSKQISWKLLLASILVPFIIFPLVLTVTFVLLFIRYVFVRSLQKIFRKDLSGLVSPMSSLFAAKDIFDKPEHVVVAIIYVEGKFNLDYLRTEFHKKLGPGSRPGSSSDECYYPQLAQYPTTWLGYSFWKPDLDFNPKNHFRYLKLKYPLKTRNQVLELGETLLTEPFKRRKSPWEIIVVHDVESSVREDTSESGEVSVIFMRTHHALADGLSLSRIYSKFLTGTAFRLEEIVEKVKKGQPKPLGNIFKKPWKVLLFPFIATYEILENFTTAQDLNPWHVPDFKMVTKLRWETVPRLSIEKLQATKDFFKESGSTQAPSTFGLVLLGVTRGLRAAFADEGSGIPEIIHCAAPIPVPGHSDQLDNHFTFCVFALPVGLKTSAEAIIKIEEDLLSLKSSTIPWTGVIFPYLLGLWPKYVISKVFTWYLTTGIITSFPGPKGVAKALGCPIYEIGALGSYLGNISFMITSFGYDGHIHMNVGMDTDLVNESSRKHLAGRIAAAFQEF